MREKYQPNIFRKLKWKLEAAQDWVRYRTYDKYHIVHTDLEPAYYDKDTLLLHANFSILAQFVEVECAWMNDVFDKKKRNWRFKLPRIIRNTLFPISSREDGLAFIDWHITHESTDEDKRNMGFETDEAYEAYRKDYSAPWKEIQDLYIWWKDIRPARQDPMDLSGWSAWCDDKRQKYGSWLDPSNMKEIEVKGQKLFEMINRNTPEEQAEEKRILDLNHKIEEEQEKEDEDMLVRLIKIRRCLWT